MFEVKVKGFKELQKKLKNMGADIDNLLVEAVADGAAVVARAAQENSRKGGNFPHRVSGTLYRSIRIQDTRKFPSRVEVDVGTALEYAKFLEYGTGIHGPKNKAYIIRPRKKRMLAWKQGGNVIMAKKVIHPGMPPRPFLRPALDENTAEIERAISNKIKTIIGRYT